MCISFAEEPGFYSYREIKEMIAAGGEVRVDRDAKAAYMVYGDQWVSGLGGRGGAGC